MLALAPMLLGRSGKSTCAGRQRPRLTLRNARALQVRHLRAPLNSSVRHTEPACSASHVCALFCLEDDIYRRGRQALLTDGGGMPNKQL